MLWNSLALLVLMADGLIFKSLTLSQSIKSTFAAFIIAGFCIAFILSILQTYRSKVSKIRRKVYEGSVTSCEEGNCKMLIEFEADRETVEAFNSNFLSQEKVKIYMKWSDKLASTSRLTMIETSAVHQTRITGVSLIHAEKI
jgi:hypothetical protein